MKAAFIRECGLPQNIQYGDLPDPTPSGDQVLVRVKAVAVNPIDTYIRAGGVKMNIPTPYVIGCDVAGVVEQAPAGSRYRVGDRVWGSNQGLFGRQGSFSELAAIDAAWLYPTPPTVSDEAAAAGALVGITAHLGLFRCAALRPGEIVFVNGGTGGVGSSVVQMVKATGAYVVTTVGSDAKAEAARQLGADLAINYKTEDVDTAIKQFAPQGVNIYWETLREPDFDRAVALLAPRGRMVIMAGREARPVFPVGPFYVKDCSLFGFAMFNATPTEQQACAEDINRWLAAGTFRPRIDRVLPLSEAAAAHRLQEENTLQKAGTLAGKIVLVP
ncbi:MAG: NADPH:quinone reductase [Planctomycetaceae bacterium]|nr:NADPH:quinone reductase [Planctomycetaceae bacterium]